MLPAVQQAGLGLVDGPPLPILPGKPANYTYSVGQPEGSASDELLQLPPAEGPQGQYEIDGNTYLQGDYNFRLLLPGVSVEAFIGATLFAPASELNVKHKLQVELGFLLSWRGLKCMRFRIQSSKSGIA
jgi:hypothetical protein